MTDQYDNAQNHNAIESTSTFSTQESAQPKFDREQQIYNGLSAKYAKQAVDGARWFYWLAGLSIVNSILAQFEGNISFLFGLGITQIIDAFAYLFAEEVSSETGIIIKLVGLVLSIFVASFGFVIGYFGLKGKKWILTIGVVLYIIDVLICLLFALYLDAAFHIFVLFFLIRGIRAFNKLDQFTKKPDRNPSMPLHQS